MSNLVIDKNIFDITGWEVVSNSPYDSSTSENSLIEHTYHFDAQRFEFKIKAETATDTSYAAFNAIMDQVGGYDSVLFDVRSFGNDVMPYNGTLTNNLHLQNQALAGATEFTYDHTAVNGSGVTPDGVLYPGDYVQFKGKAKIYMITSHDSVTHKYTVLPSLRETVATDTEVLYSNDVLPRVKMKASTFKWNSAANVPKLRKYSFTLVENPF